VEYVEACIAIAILRRVKLNKNPMRQRSHHWVYTMSRRKKANFYCNFKGCSKICINFGLYSFSDECFENYPQPDVHVHSTLKCYEMQNCDKIV